MHRWLGLALLAVACGPEPATPFGYIAPLDGQTGIPTEMPLIVTADQLEIPPDYPLPSDLISVVDLDEGGFVPGTTSIDGQVLVFEPDAPWRVAVRYAWTVGGTEGVPHGPELGVPPELDGTAVFDTSTVALDILGATIDPDHGVCLVFSRTLRPQDALPVRVSANDIPLENPVFTLISREDWPVDLPALPPNDPGVDIGCLTATVSLSPGTSLRVWAGDDSWRFELVEGPVADLLMGLRRGSW